MAVISSRTPEGEPARCPVCGKKSLVVPSAFPTPDAPCPHCGHLLWLTGDPEHDLAAADAVGAVLAELAEYFDAERVELGLHEITDAVEIRRIETQRDWDEEG